MEVKISLKDVRISEEEILLKLEEFLGINNTMYLSPDNIVMSEYYGNSLKTDVDPDLFIAFRTVHDYLMKCNKYADKSLEKNKNEDNIEYVPIERMKKLW